MRFVLELTDDLRHNASIDASQCLEGIVQHLLLLTYSPVFLAES